MNNVDSFILKQKYLARLYAMERARQKLRSQMREGKELSNEEVEKLSSEMKSEWSTIDMIFSFYEDDQDVDRKKHKYVGIVLAIIIAIVVTMVVVK